MKAKNVFLVKIIIIASLMMATIFSVSTFAAGWTMLENGEWSYIDNDGDIVTDTIKKSGDDKYFLNDQGIMVRDYLLEDFNDATYYFDDDGKMVKDTWVAVDPYQTSDPLDYGPTVYLYYFSNTGKAYKAVSGFVKKTIDGKKYMFDEAGRMLSGWINSSGEMFSSQDGGDDPFLDDYIYYAGDETDGVLHEGWLEYTDGSLETEHDYYKKEVMWFYFNPNNNKKVRYDGSNGNPYGDYYQKKVNGYSYAFDENGVMMVGWEASKATRYHSENQMDGSEGKLLKKQWFYTIPSEAMGLGKNDALGVSTIKGDYDDEVERWFYAGNNGNIIKGMMKRINGKEYVFDDFGIMKSGLVIVDRSNKKFVATIDVEGTNGKDYLVDRQFFDRDKQIFIPETGLTTPETFDPKKHKILYFVDEEEDDRFGERKDGTVKLAFADDDYEFTSDTKGEYEGYKKKKGKKYYQYGLLLKADPSIGYGIVLDGYASPSIADDVFSLRKHTQFRDVSFEGAYGVNLPPKYNGNEYHVYYDKAEYEAPDAGSHWEPVYKMVDTSGKLNTKANSIKKDKNNNYWILDHQGYLVKIVSVNVKYNKRDNTWVYRSETYNSNDKAKTQWIPFNITDLYGFSVHLGDKNGGYDVEPDESYALNFSYIND